jgi:2-oxoisovalerate dehydrogenase E2 component (dihydrolipoyl transacylase)
LALGGEVGATLAVGAELVRLEVAGEGNAEVAAAPREAAPTARPPAERLTTPPPPPKTPAPTPVEAATPVARGSLGPPRPAGEKPIASPAVRRRAREAGIDLRQVRGSGPAGRISHDDLDAFLRSGPQAAPSGGGRVARTEVETVKVIGLRRRIAQKMAESKRRAAHFSYVEEIDVTALEDLRAKLNAENPDRPRLTLMPFLMQALVRAVADFPEMNALYDDEAETIERHAGVHIGIATQTPSGLMVPVARHCEARGLWDCAAEVRRLAEAARNGQATRAELLGSTITITSLGPLGGIVTTPVLNRPEVAIIGVNRQVVRPVWQGAEFVPRTMMNLSSSFDHRVIDGYNAAQFVQRIKGLLEAPATIFIEA